MNYIKVKSTWLAESGLRLDASYHLSDGPLTKLKLKKSPYTVSLLSKETKQIFKGNIFKRVYVSNDENGYQFMTASDMMKSDIKGGKYISKKYTNTANLILDKDWILVSRSGTLGNTVYTNEDFVGIVGTDDLIRVIPNNKNVLSGYLYSYLTSKHGYGLLTQSGYGAVVKHIEPHHILNLPIPIFPKDKQEKIHNLIVEASKLRVEANKLLKEAQNTIISRVNFMQKETKLNVSINSLVNSHLKRFEAQHFISEGMEIRDHIKSLDYKLLKELCKPIYRPGIFKRHYVDKGVDFLGGSDIVRRIPKSDKKLSKVKTKHLEELKIKENWILVTCGGSIGNSVLVDKYMDGKAASQHILRVIADDIPYGYLFAFISSKLGQKTIQSFTYGSVIPQIEPHHLELLPIPILEKELMSSIHKMIVKYKENLSDAIYKELQAIDLVEKEIESWQK